MNKTAALFLFFGWLFATGCKPKACIDSGGGVGGNASISVIPEHQGVLIDSCTIYIKYGTLNTPPDNVYDDSQKCVMVDTIPIATFVHLKPGLYYFYGNGYHTGYSPPGVMGAAHYTMCSEQAVSIYLPTY